MTDMPIADYDDFDFDDDTLYPEDDSYYDYEDEEDEDEDDEVTDHDFYYEAL